MDMKRILGHLDEKICNLGSFDINLLKEIRKLNLKNSFDVLKFLFRFYFNNGKCNKY